ncbi:bacteriorhodopsin [Nodularia sphaerocarpa]|uniref:bacteriorhodopsin n=1 Tax=Nodularia sphaerocarpa TaxID=137816 RepID=UPI001EFAFA9D|nr:bacteriorhodopsin [Nodularia sphaerocarpa]MDB9372993.1 bacteriorhodopsin [Nodularia sphaerocarpa CS-585]MDB9380347.1 bacteriorhodopsin [Nodularia sphaerocarpa CS-585A2]ULP71602.1 Green-light absorbing proteorhodopsin [Nodularia sphaerocarpa UHCC 0038]
MHLIKRLIPIAGISLVILILATQVQAFTVFEASRFPEGINLENIFTYTPLQYAIVTNVFTLGFAAQAAGLIYFVATLRKVSPPYRLASVLSAVVMVSAFLELLRMEQNWQNAFVFTDGFWRLGTEVFFNGFRYINWSIDVPLLLLQLVIVLGLTQNRAISYSSQLIIGGLLMIWTGYIGQFYEVTNLALFAFWGIVSTLFYMYILLVVWELISTTVGNLPSNLQGMMRNIRWYILITWSFYPIAYVLPVFWSTEWTIVTRQIIFSFADITTKVIYGAILTYIARQRSQADNYQEAIATVHIRSSLS